MTDHRQKNLVFVLLLVLAAFLPRIGRASEARMAALSGNPMVQNYTDVVDYPGLLSVYGNTAFLTVFPGAPWGNAGVFGGDRIVVGAWVHRQSAWRDLDKTKELFGLNLPTTYDLFDFYIGTPVGFGLRLTLSGGLDSVDQLFGDNDLSSNGASTFAFDVGPGYSFDTRRYHGDFGASISFSHFQIAENGQSAYTTGWIPSFLIRHRSVIGEKEAPVGGVIDLSLTRRAYSARSEDDNGDAADMGRWVATVVAGPRFQLPHNFSIWAGLRIQVEHLSGTIGGNEQPALPGVGAPGAVLSGEITLWDLLVIRAGVVYDIYWTIQKVSDPVDRSKVIYQDRAMGQRFQWSTGLGFLLRDFQIDATVEQRLYFDGPNVIGGRDPGLFGMLSVSYLWY